MMNWGGCCDGVPGPTLPQPLLTQQHLVAVPTCPMRRLRESFKTRSFRPLLFNFFFFFPPSLLNALAALSWALLEQGGMFCLVKR